MPHATQPAHHVVVRAGRIESCRLVGAQVAVAVGGALWQVRHHAVGYHAAAWRLRDVGHAAVPAQLEGLCRELQRAARRGVAVRPLLEPAAAAAAAAAAGRLAVSGRGCGALDGCAKALGSRYTGCWQASAARGEARDEWSESSSRGFVGGTTRSQQLIDGATSPTEAPAERGAGKNA